MSTLPNEQECIDILRMAGAPDRVIKHICTVTVLAQAIARKSGADVRLVTAGAMLHDIGRTRTHGIRHAVEGVAIARSLGLPEPVVLIIQKHTWAGMDPEEAEQVGLPPMDYMPSTLEEKIVCHADNLVGDATYMTSAETYQEFVRKGYLSTGERFMEMHRELSFRCGEDVVYYFLPSPMWEGGPTPQLAVLGVLIAALVFEIIRLLFGLKVPGMRPYEAEQISAAAWAAMALTITFLFFPLEYAAPVLIGMAVVDPIIGRLRRTKWYPVVPYLLHLAIMLGVLGLLVPMDWWTVIVAVVVSALALLAEGIKTRYVDDDFLMIVVPLLGLAALMSV